MFIKETTPLHKAGNSKRVFLTLWKRIFDHKGKEGTYFMVSRGDKISPHHEKRPDAVVIVATINVEGEDRLVVTNEFRIPLGVRELGFPAGLIDENDYRDNATNAEAARRAAIRELKEETGVDLEVTEVSPSNLYSSAGLTNESVTYVFGKATGVLSQDGLEEDEDIETMLVSRPEVEKLLHSEGDFAHSKSAWPLLWAFVRKAL